MNTDNPKATSREWIGLAVIALPCVLYSMDLTVLNLAVPSLSADLKPSSTQLLWIVDIYGFLLAGLLMTMGSLGDRFGRRRLLLIGAGAFGAASVLAAASGSAPMLIGARALLGIAGATLAPSTLSLIRNMFLDARERTFAVGVWATSFSVGAALGPLLGGIVLQSFGWGAVFLLAVPVMALLLAVGPVLLPEFRDPDAGRPDLPSAALSLVAVLSVIFGVKRIAEYGWMGTSAVFIAAGFAVGFVFTRRQRQLADPLIDLQLFRLPAFSASLAAYALSVMVTFGIFFYVAQYLQLVLGLPPLRAGLWTLPSSTGFIVGSMAGPLLVRRIRPAYVMAGGMLLAVAGFVLLTQASAGGLTVVVAGTILLALGIAPVVTLATDLVIGAAPPQRAGAASGISETGAELGGALGIALLGSIGTAVYRHTLRGAPVDTLSPDMSAAARATLGGALDVARQLPTPLNTELLASARAAFVHAFELAAGISAALLAALAVMTAILLRHARTDKPTSAP